MVISDYLYLEMACQQKELGVVWASCRERFSVYSSKLLLSSISFSNLTTFFFTSSSSFLNLSFSACNFACDVWNISFACTFTAYTLASFEAFFVIFAFFLGGLLAATSSLVIWLPPPSPILWVSLKLSLWVSLGESLGLLSPATFASFWFSIACCLHVQRRGTTTPKKKKKKKKKKQQL